MYRAFCMHESEDEENIHVLEGSEEKYENCQLS
jgi:hypothetical protein